jgi:chemotaxis protein histidine kinase CheA
MSHDLKPKPDADVIPPAAYPQLLRSVDVAEFVKTVTSPETTKRAENVIASKSNELRDAVHGYVVKLETAANSGNFNLLYDEAHEIRGMAETVGLVAAGRIANGLCGYLDEVERSGLATDATLVKLYVEATARATRATDDTTRLGGAVAMELAVLATHKLMEAKDKVKK